MSAIVSLEKTHITLRGCFYCEEAIWWRDGLNLQGIVNQFPDGNPKDSSKISKELRERAILIKLDFPKMRLLSTAQKVGAGE